VVDYADPGWLAQVVEATGGAGPDVVFDGVGGSPGQAAFGIVADGGRFSAHGVPGGGFTHPSAHEAEERGIMVRSLGQVQHPPGRLEELVAQALAEAAAGRLRPVIGQVYSLDRAADAHAAIAARTTDSGPKFTPQPGRRQQPAAVCAVGFRRGAPPDLGCAVSCRR
jgi:NADPH2:quinone reductase